MGKIGRFENELCEETWGSTWVGGGKECRKKLSKKKPRSRGAEKRAPKTIYAGGISDGKDWPEGGLRWLLTRKSKWDMSQSGKGREDRGGINGCSEKEKN